jgi:hypothetical protein
MQIVCIKSIETVQNIYKIFYVTPAYHGIYKLRIVLKYICR